MYIAFTIKESNDLHPRFHRTLLIGLIVYMLASGC